ncbi:MAG TPA: DMT family transporter [Gaiellaceae bacterium]|nr:DMT family transporter [Gaiellaceae bacterium]
MSGLAVLLAVLGGLAGSVQVAVMGRFGGRIGVLEALAFSTAIQLVISIAVMLAARGGIGGLRQLGSTPVWMWIGGLMGFTVVTSITFAQPRIGATAVIGILIAGQLVMGAVIDRFGLFGVEQIGISPARAVGIGLLGIGAALSLVR